VGAPQSAQAYAGMDSRQVYLAKRLTGATMVERYVEWVGAGVP